MVRRFATRLGLLALIAVMLGGLTACQKSSSAGLVDLVGAAASTSTIAADAAVAPQATVPPPSTPALTHESACMDGRKERWTEGAGPMPAAYTVRCTIDGDTLIVTGPDGVSRSLRFVGPDTPEAHKGQHDGAPVDVQCFGAEASANTHALAPDGSTITVNPEGKMVDTSYQSNRQLGVPHLPDGTDLTVNIVATGHARVWKHLGKTTPRYKELAAAQADAQRAGLGLWGVPASDPCHANDPK